MATNPSATSILQSMEQWLPLVESLAGAGLTIAGQPEIAALATAVENALNPLFASIASKSTTQQDIMAGWVAAIGIWTAISNKTSLDSATKARVTEYIASGEQAMAKFYLAQAGFDPTLYAPVQPVA